MDIGERNPASSKMDIFENDNKNETLRHFIYVLRFIVWLYALFYNYRLCFMYKNTDIFKMSILLILVESFETT